MEWVRSKKNTSKRFERYVEIARRVSFHIGNPFFQAILYFIILISFLIHFFSYTGLQIIRSAHKWVRGLKLLKKRPKISINLRINWTLIGVLIVLTLGVVSYLTNFIYELPSPEELSSRKQEVSTKIYDRNGTLLYKIYKDKNRTPVPLSEIPQHVIDATLAIEDSEFYSHPGFSIRGISRALLKNIREGTLTGGSTITQQLVKNALLTPEKTIMRKIREVITAMRVEASYSKDQILEMYLNEVAYGGTAYGIQEASRVYFGKDVFELSLSEAALLAGLPRSPTRYSPFGTNPELALSRQEEVLLQMEINGFITPQEKDAAVGADLKFAADITNIKAPHFVMYVKQYLVDRFGEDVVETGGLEVVTSLDINIQNMAQEMVASEVERLKNLNVSNGAAIVLNPKSGEVLAMVGSRNYFDREIEGNVNVTLRPRQPGSSIKMVNYAYALSNGYSAASILKDSPITYSIPGSLPYTPKNYDGKFRGNLSLRSAFAESRNVPAVRTLASYGVDKMIDLGKKMGITTWEDRGRFGLSLTLGGGEVKLLELAQVYSTVANYGKRPEITPVLKVTNYKGKVLEERCVECEQEQVLDPRVAFILTDILKDNGARTPAFGANSSLNIKDHKEVAVKTGTSNNLRDNLTLGYNQNYLVATWVGNNDNSPMSRVASGVTGATPIWNKIMTNLLADSSNHDWNAPEGLQKISICSLTGTLPCGGCPSTEEWFLIERVPAEHCSMEAVAEKRKEEKVREKRWGEILNEAWRD